MQLTPDDIKEFQRIWKQEFGEDISAEYAHERASQVLDLYYALYVKEVTRAQRPSSGPSSLQTKP